MRPYNSTVCNKDAEEKNEDRIEEADAADAADVPLPGANLPAGVDPKLVQGGGFSSSHEGGAHFGMGDGSVRFISENINVAIFQNLANRDDGEMISDF